MLNRLHLRAEEWVALVGAAAEALSLIITLPGVKPPQGSENVEKWLQVVGIALLVTGLSVSLVRIRRITDKIETLSESTHALIRFGGAASTVAQALLRASEGGPHARAGTRALENYALTVLPNRANELLQLTPERTFRLVEHHYINDFLLRLVEELPAGSIWCGVTHLTEGWLEPSAEPGYLEVVRRIQDRSRAGELTALRIYCSASEGDLAPLKAHLRRERESGIQVATLVAGAGEWRPPDLTLIWPPVPRELRAELVNQSDPIDRLRKSAPLPACAMEFATTAGRMIRELNIHGSQSPAVLPLVQNFERAWGQAQQLGG